MSERKDLERESGISLSFPECVSILKDILREWWVILLVAMAVAMAADAVGTMLYQPEYRASSTFVVKSKDVNNNIVADLRSASETAQQFSQILSSNVLKQKVVQEAGMETFDAQMEAVLIPETNLMELTVTADSPEKAFGILQAVMDNYNSVSDYVIDNVYLEVLQKPSIPLKPSNHSNSSKNAKTGFLVTALLMIGLIGVLSYTRDTIKSPQEVSEKVDAHMMGTIYHENKGKSLKDRLHEKKISMTILNPMLSFRYLESNKMAASRIRSRMESKNARILAVTSVMENEGKSTIAANLALALAQEKKKVLLMDCDFRKPAQYKIFNKDTSKVKDFNDVLTGKADMTQLIQTIEGTDLLGIFNLTGNMHMFENHEQKILEAILNQLKMQLDYIIIDTSPIGLVAETEEVAMLSDASLLVIHHDLVLASDINDAVDALNQTNGKVIGCLLNDVPGVYGMDGAYGYGYGYGYRYGGHYGK